MKLGEFGTECRTLHREFIENAVLDMPSNLALLFHRRRGSGDREAERNGSG